MAGTSSSGRGQARGGLPGTLALALLLASACQMGEASRPRVLPPPPRPAPEPAALRAPDPPPVRWQPWAGETAGVAVLVLPAPDSGLLRAELLRPADGAAVPEPAGLPAGTRLLRVEEDGLAGWRCASLARDGRALIGALLRTASSGDLLALRGPVDPAWLGEAFRARPAGADVARPAEADAEGTDAAGSPSGLPAAASAPTGEAALGGRPALPVPPERLGSLLPADAGEGPSLLRERWRRELERRVEDPEAALHLAAVLFLAGADPDWPSWLPDRVAAAPEDELLRLAARARAEGRPPPSGGETLPAEDPDAFLASFAGPREAWAAAGGIAVREEEAPGGPGRVREILYFPPDRYRAVLPGAAPDGGEVVEVVTEGAAWLQWGSPSGVQETLLPPGPAAGRLRGPAVLFARLLLAWGREDTGAVWSAPGELRLELDGEDYLLRPTAPLWEIEVPDGTVLRYTAFTKSGDLTLPREAHQGRTRWTFLDWRLDPLEDPRWFTPGG